MTPFHIVAIVTTTILLYWIFTDPDDFEGGAT